MEAKTITECSPHVKAFLQGVEGVVEANSYEGMCIWKGERDRFEAMTVTEKAEIGGRLPWDQHNGYLVTVGEIGDMPVCFSILINVVRGMKLLFVEPTSVVVDHRMFEAWLQANLPDEAFKMMNGKRVVHRTNAMNFHNIFSR
jgi:hypothetical protein